MTTGLGASGDVSALTISFEGQGLGGFGAAVTVGDEDGSGAADLFVGAPGDSVWRSDVAAIFLDPGSGTLPIVDADLILTGGAYDDAGYAVASGSDVDGDGCDEIVIGAPGAYNGSVVAAGAAYIVSGCSLW